MSTVTLPYPNFTGGTKAVGSQVVGNDDAIIAVVNGGIDDDNITNSGITASTKLKNGTVTASKMATASIVDASNQYASASSGVKVWRLGPNYPGAQGGQIIRVEKAVTIPAASTEQTVSVDWSATDALDGAVTFAAAPTITGAMFLDTGTAIDNTLQYLKCSARSSTGASFKYKFASAPTGGSVTLMFHAAGGLS